MQSLKYIVAAVALLICTGAHAGDKYDAEGMPIFHLTGEVWHWNPASGPVFAREGNHYHLHVSNLDGQFKISTEEWEINYGAPDKQALSISEPMWVAGLRNGGNLVADDLRDVDIYFNYTGGNNMDIAFEYNGVKLPPLSSTAYTGTLPVMYINVYDADGQLDNEVIDYNLAHKNYFKGEYWLELPDGAATFGGSAIGSAQQPLPLEIKARGNWTRIGFAKKPFKLKLGSKQKLLGMSKSKHYALLAAADDDAGFMRNYVGFTLGRAIGLPWTPSQQPVEVVINGDYRGLYFLTESIRVESDRVNIAELADECTDGPLVSGGYIVELDNYDEENQIRMTEQTCAGIPCDLLRVTFDTPEVYSDLQKRFITDQFTTMNRLAGTASDELWQYMDLDDAARYYIVEEIMGHTEAYHGSTYLFRDRGEGQKWHFSPLWDFGNAFRGPVNDYFYLNTPFGATWIPSMRLNGKFNQRVSETWRWFMHHKFQPIYQEITNLRQTIAAAAVADHQRWKNVPAPKGGAPVANNSDMEAREKTVIDYLTQKTAWLATQFGDYSGDKDIPEPIRDTTPAAPLPDYAGLAEIIADNTDGPAIYYNLQGQPVSNPSHGLYIRRTPRSAAKVLLP